MSCCLFYCHLSSQLDPKPFKRVIADGLWRMDYGLRTGYKTRTANKTQTMYLLTEWEGRTGKYLARGQGVRTERSEFRAS